MELKMLRCVTTTRSLKPRNKFQSTASGRSQRNVRGGFEALCGKTWRSGTTLQAQIHSVSAVYAVSSCVAFELAPWSVISWMLDGAPLHGVLGSLLLLV